VVASLDLGLMQFLARWAPQLRAVAQGPVGARIAAEPDKHRPAANRRPLDAVGHKPHTPKRKRRQSANRIYDSVKVLTIMGVSYSLFCASRAFGNGNKELHARLLGD